MIYRLRCKYSRLVAFEDILAGRLDEMISDII